MIQLKFNDKEEIITIKIDNNRKIYISEEKKYDIIIIEINDKDGINLENCINIDENLFKYDNLNIFYKNFNIYIINNPNGLKSKISFGKIKDIYENNYEINILCSTEKDTSGCPIFNSFNNKLIGFYKGQPLFDKIGIALKLPILEFYIQENKNNINENIFKKYEINIDSLIQKLLSIKDNNSNQKIILEENEIIYIIDKSLSIIKNENTLIELKPPINVCGDIRGEYYDLLDIFNKFGYPNDLNNYLFLGNYVDDGKMKMNIETICLLLCYKIKYPQKIALLRGNHEDINHNRIYGFYDECKKRYNIRLCLLFNYFVFDYLPIAAIIGKKIFCVHGGLSPKLYNLKDILDIKRPTKIPDDGLLCNLLNSSPDEYTSDYMDESKGIGIMYGEKVIINFIKKNNFDLIIRSHQIIDDGVEFFAGGQLVTIFSMHHHEFNNSAGIACIDEKMKVNYQVIKPKLNTKND